jgi:integrase
MPQGIRSKGKDRWEIRFSVDGSSVSRMFRGSAKEAARERRRLLKAAEEGRFRHRDKTLAMLLEAWLNQAQRKLSPTTIRSYRSYLDNRVIPALGSVPLHKLTTAELDGFYMDLEDAGLAPRSVHQCHSIIRRALRQGRIWGWVHDDPASLATLPRVPESELSPPNVAEVLRLFEEAAKLDPLMAVLIYVAADTGARRGELCGLRWLDLDAAEGTLMVARAVVDLHPGQTKVKDTKSHQRRRVALWPPTIKALALWHQEVLQEARLARVEPCPDPFMFSREPDGSTPLFPWRVTKSFHAIRDAAGVTCRFHDLRHFVGTELHARNVPLAAISRRLGHRLVSTTSDIYAHTTDEADRRASQVMGELLNPDAQKGPAALPPAEGTESGAGGAP